MAALYIPKSGSFQALVNQLKALEALDAEAFAQIEKRFRSMKQPNTETSIIIQMAALAANETIEQNEPIRGKSSLNNHVLQELIHAAHAKLGREKPQRLERQQLSQWQKEIKEPESRSTSALNLIGRTDPVQRLHDTIKHEFLNHEEGEPDDISLLQTIHVDAERLHRLLTPSVSIHRDGNSVTENHYDHDKFLHNPPDIIFIMGNNDLRQIDFIASLYADLKHIDSPYMPKFYVSGFGGHGTMHDEVFSLSEGETMVKRLRDHGVPQEQIVVEYDAVDTGRNVKYMDIIILLEYTLKRNQELMNKNVELNQEDAAFLEASELTPEKIAFLEQMRGLGTTKRSGAEDEKLEAILNPIKNYLNNSNTRIHTNILISGTPGGLLRQTRTFEKQTTLPWVDICCLKPHEFTKWPAENYYYATQKAALINFIYALREVASFVDYTVNKEFISNRMIIDRKNLKNCLETLAFYYNYMAKPSEQFDGSEFANNFIRFSEYKSLGQTDSEECQQLKRDLNLDILPISEYYRKAFLDIEYDYMKQVNLSRKFTPNEQAEILDSNSGPYTRLGLMRFGLYSPPKTPRTLAQEDKTVENISIATLKI